MPHEFRRRVWSLYILPWFCFSIVAFATRDQALILVLNIVRTSIATGVAVTFARDNWRIAMGFGPLRRSQTIAYGIFNGWAFVAASGMLTLIWRMYGQPLWMVNTDIVSTIIFGQCIGGFAHMWRSGELDGDIPLKRNIRLAALVAAALAVGLTVLQWAELERAWTGVHVSRRQDSGVMTAVAGPAPSPDETEIDIFREAMPVSPEAAKPTAPPVAGKVRVETDVSPEFRARVEQSRVANGDKSIAAAVRRLLARALAAEDRDALGPYEPGRR